MTDHCAFLRAGELSAIVGDDTPRGPGGRQYSGLWSLLSTHCAASPFQSAFAGLIAARHRGTGPVLEQIDETAARLVKKPHEGCPFAEVRGTYRLIAPYYVDYTYEVEFTKDATAIPDCVENLWCSYMNSPQDISIHFIENNGWTTLTPDIHGAAATVFPAGLDEAHRLDWERRTGEARFRDQTAFHHSFSGRTFDYPFYYGLIHGMAWLIMADHHRDFRFFISPWGAGSSAIPGQSSPAWDFAWLIWNAKPGETRTLNLRLAFFKPEMYNLPAQVWKEWEAFRETHPVK